MNNLSKELIKVSKLVSAGPGAGITFKITDMENDPKYIITLKKGKVTNIKLTRLPVIQTFEAFGYDDGMEKVDGRLMKVTDIVFEWDIISKEIEEEIDVDDAVLTLEADLHLKSTTIFGGYSRGKVENGYVFHFEGSADLNYSAKGIDGALEAECILVVRATEDMESFYEDVFTHYYPDDDEVKAFMTEHNYESEDSARSALLDQHYSDAKINYQR